MTIPSLQENYIIRDFANLTIVEIITLQMLLRYSNPIIRYSLYTLVNQFLKIKDIEGENLYNDVTETELMFYNSLKNKKKVSSSSFYNNLTNLEAKGLIKFNLDKKGRINTIEATQLTRLALYVIFQHILQSIPNRTKISSELSKKIEEKVGDLSFKNVLLINLCEDLTLENVREYSKIYEALFILPFNNKSDDIFNSELENVNISRIYNNKIREPNDIFDMVRIGSYCKISDLYGISRIDLLKEVIRITKPGGFVIITAISKFPLTQSYYADELLKMARKTIEDLIFEEDQFRDDMNNAGFSKLEIFNYKGILVGIGKKIKSKS